VKSERSGQPVLVPQLAVVHQQHHGHGGELLVKEASRSWSWRQCVRTSVGRARRTTLHYRLVILPHENRDARDFPAASGAKIESIGCGSAAVAMPR